MTKKLSPRQAARIGARLKAARKRDGHKLKGVSSLSGVNYSQLSRFERGDFRILSKNVQKISNFLQISLDVEDGRQVPRSDLGERAALVAAQSVKNRRLLEAVLEALDDSHPTTHPSA